MNTVVEEIEVIGLVPFAINFSEEVNETTEAQSVNYGTSKTSNDL